MRKRSLVYVVLMAFLISSFMLVTVLAHTVIQTNILQVEYSPRYQRYFTGGEQIGWMIDERSHAGTTSIKYRYGSGMTDELKSKISTGASMWSAVTNIQHSIFSGNVIKVQQGDTDVVASVTIQSVDEDTHHITRWEMNINQHHLASVTPDVIAHEFGHVIGLADLYEEYNQDKIMYGINTENFLSPTQQDLWGAKVILGIHSDHMWSYTYVYLANSNYHDRVCLECGGIGLREACVAVLNGGLMECSICGALL